MHVPHTGDVLGLLRSSAGSFTNHGAPSLDVVFGRSSTYIKDVKGTLEAAHAFAKLLATGGSETSEGT